MLFKLIACNVFTREACLAVAESPHTIDLEFTEIGEHSVAERLQKRLQAMIDETEAGDKRYDAILLLFGLCGNATLNLTSQKTRLVIPRAHDCCAIFLGSKKVFEEHFRENPSTPFSTVGYMERSEYFLRTPDDQSEAGMDDPLAAYIEEYGEENGRYIWETLHPGAREENAQAFFIDVPETHHLADVDDFREKVEARGLQFALLSGNMRLIRSLARGDWPEADFLVVAPGEKVNAVYDWDEIVRAVPAEAKPET